MNESKQRKAAFPDLYGTPQCPGAGFRPRSVLCIPRPVKTMPVITPHTSSRHVGRMMLAIARRRDLVNRVGHLSKQLKVDEVTAAAWLIQIPRISISRSPRWLSRF